LAVGISARLHDMPADKPKGFIEIEGQSLIERSLAHLFKHGIETDPHGMLCGMSKTEMDLRSVCGELVGISKISAVTFQRVCALLEKDEVLLKTIEYEYAFTRLSRTYPIKIEKIEDLIWAEIDTQEHFERVKTLIYPKLKLLNSS